MNAVDLPKGHKKRLVKGKDWDGWMMRWKDGEWHSHFWHRKPPRSPDYTIHRVKIMEVKP